MSPLMRKSLHYDYTWQFYKNLHILGGSKMRIVSFRYRERKEFQQQILFNELRKDRTSCDEWKRSVRGNGFIFYAAKQCIHHVWIEWTWHSSMFNPRSIFISFYKVKYICTPLILYLTQCTQTARVRVSVSISSVSIFLNFSMLYCILLATSGKKV